ncbi:hypothetical protein Plhal304r1_c025g0084941 [Plasmopara halstedii]
MHVDITSYSSFLRTSKTANGSIEGVTLCDRVKFECCLYSRMDSGVSSHHLQDSSSVCFGTVLVVIIYRRDSVFPVTVDVLGFLGDFLIPL